MHKLFILYQIWCHCNSILIHLYDIFIFIFHYIEMFSVFSVMAVIKESIIQNLTAQCITCMQYSKAVCNRPEISHCHTCLWLSATLIAIGLHYICAKQEIDIHIYWKIMICWKYLISLKQIFFGYNCFSTLLDKADIILQTSSILQDFTLILIQLDLVTQHAFPKPDVKHLIDHWNVFLLHFHCIRDYKTICEWNTFF